MPPKIKPKGIQPRKMDVILAEGNEIHKTNMAAKWKVMEYLEALPNLYHNKDHLLNTIEKAKAELIKIR